jgi:hypothetical protein
MGQKLRYRLGGLIAILAGIGFAYWGIWLPLEAARARAPEVHYQISIFVAVPAMLVFGLYLLIGGGAWPYRNVEKQTPTAVGWVLMAAVAVCSGASFWWLTGAFAALGYRNG